MSHLPSDLRAFCDRWLAAWTGNQPEGLAEFYTDDALYRDPARPDGLRGRAELLGYFRRLLGANPRWVWRAVELAPTADGCWLKWHATIPVGNEPGSAVVEETGLDLIEFRDGKISRNEVYFDRTALLTAMSRG